MIILTNTISLASEAIGVGTPEDIYQNQQGHSLHVLITQFAFASRSMLPFNRKESVRY